MKKDSWPSGCIVIPDMENRGNLWDPVIDQHLELDLVLRTVISHGGQLLALLQ